MNALYGTVYHQMDDKFRVRIPSKFFPQGENGQEEPAVKQLSLIAGAQGCIRVYETEVLEAWLNERLSALANTPDGASAKRKIMGSVERVDVDKQCRIVLPQNLRNYAGIKKELVSIGMGDYFEIWAKEAQEKEDASMSFERAFAQLGYM